MSNYLFKSLNFIQKAAQENSNYSFKASVSESINSTSNGNTYKVTSINTENRSNLKHLQKALEDALRKYFYNHVHSGENNNPSKIDLSTYDSYYCEIPADFESTTTFFVKDENGNTVTWDENTKGNPFVFINNVEISKTYFSTSPSEGKIFLKNSVPQGSVVKVLFYKSFEIELSPIDNIKNGGYLRLAKPDSTDTYKWNPNNYTTPEVYFNKVLVNNSGDTKYTIYPDLGNIVFDNINALGITDTTTNTDLVVKFRYLDVEIENKLSGNRISDIDASTFSAGTLSENRLTNLEHFRTFRFKEEAVLQPKNKLFDIGDHKTYVPEVLNSPLQYDTEITYIYYSEYIESFLIGTKRGLIKTKDFIVYELIKSWTPDLGIIKKITDIQFPTYASLFLKRTYVLTEDGRIFYTEDKGYSWKKLSLPKIQDSKYTFTYPKVNDFIVSSNKRREDNKNYYSLVYYIGTENYGLYQAIIDSNNLNGEWGWTKIKFASYNQVNTIVSLEEICTLRQKFYTDQTTEETERSVYIGASDGFYALIKNQESAVLINFGDLFFSTDNNRIVQQIEKVNNPNYPNNIVFSVNDLIVETFHASLVESSDTLNKTTTKYWTHPLEPYIDLENDIATDQIVNVDVSTDADNTNITFSSYNINESSYNCRLVDFNNLSYGTSSVVYLEPNTQSINIVAGQPIRFNKTVGNVIADKIYFVREVYTATVTISGSPVTKIVSFKISETYNGPEYVLMISYYDSSLTFTTVNFLATSKITNYNNVSSINGVNLTKYQSNVLFTHFTNTQAKYNGIYTYAYSDSSKSYFYRTQYFNTSVNLRKTIYINENNTFWYTEGLGSTKNINVDTLTFNLVWKKIYTTNSPFEILSIYENSYDNNILVSTTDGTYTIQNTVNGNTINSIATKFDLSLTDSSYINSFINYNNNLYLGSERGLWYSNDFGVNFSRPNKVFTIDTSKQPVPLVFDKNYTALNSDLYIINENAQSFIFKASQNNWQEFLYEKDYLDYYIDPWSEEVDVLLIYIDNALTEIPYSTESSIGKISFDKALLEGSKVNITVINQNAFLSDIGITTHEELDNIIAVENVESTTLSTDLNPDDAYIQVANINNIPDDIYYIELRSGENELLITEKINVIKENSQLKIINRKLTTNILPADVTKVYIVKFVSQLGIEDEIMQYLTGMTYHLDSIIHNNSLQTTLNLMNELPDLFDNYNIPNTLFPLRSTSNKVIRPVTRYNSMHSYISSFTEVKNDIGLKNCIVLNNNDFSVNNLGYNYFGNTPDSSLTFNSSTTVFALSNISYNANNMYNFTNKGVWQYVNNDWKQISNFNNSNVIYFIKAIDNNSYLVGTDQGLWENSSGYWLKNNLYPEIVFDYLTSNWFNGTCSVFAKDNGIAFIWKPENSKDFKSDAFLEVNGSNVYSVFKSYYIKFEEEQQKQIDVMYLCTEKGLYGVTNGAATGNQSFLVGRELFGDNKLTHYITKNNVVEEVPVKIYKVVQNGRDEKFKPIILLTNNGVYIVRNWRWCSPLPNEEHTDFYVESHTLDNLSCLCSLNIKTTDNNNEDRIIYKIFVGTNKGVYRSYNDGYSWEKCEKINKSDLKIYNLYTYQYSGNDVIVAATNNGIYVSIDDGDNWLRPDETLNYAAFNYVMKHGLLFNRSSSNQTFYYSQNFTTPVNFPISPEKLSLYLDIRLSKD